MPRRRFNPPPNWPRPRAGWTPPDGWEPPDHWPDPPAGWQLWTEEPPRRRFGVAALAAIAAGAFLLGSGIYAAASGPGRAGGAPVTGSANPTPGGPSAAGPSARPSSPAPSSASPSRPATSRAPSSSKPASSPPSSHGASGGSGGSGDGKDEVPGGAQGPYRVLDVVDGGTLRVSVGGTSTTVRLTGVEAPATGAGDCYGTESRSHLRLLVIGRKVYLTRDPALSHVDLQGNRLAYVWRSDGRFVNESVLWGGDGRTSSLYASQEYGPRLDAAQSHARRFGRGLWSGKTCNGNLRG